MSHVVKKVLNRRKPSASTSTPTPSGPAPAPTPGSTQTPSGGQGFLASNMVRSEGAGEEEYPDSFNEALDRAVRE